MASARHFVSSLYEQLVASHDVISGILMATLPSRLLGAFGLGCSRPTQRRGIAADHRGHPRARVRCLASAREFGDLDTRSGPAWSNPPYERHLPSDRSAPRARADSVADSNPWNGIAMPRALSHVLLAVLVVGVATFTGPSIADHHGKAANRPDPAAFMKRLQDASYRDWGTFPRRDEGFYPGNSPHGDLLRLFIDETAASAPLEPKHGSTIVKENFNEDEELLSITVMKRIEGFDPENGDWWYARYTADGEITTADGKPVAGKVESCVNCHRASEGADFVFGNE